MFDHIQLGIAVDTFMNIMPCWKPFTAVNTVTLIKTSTHELKPEAENVYWKSVVKVVNDVQYFLEIDRDVRNIIEKVKQGGWEGFSNMFDEEFLEEHI